MHKRQIQNERIDDEIVIATLPVEALEALGTSAGGQLSNDYDLTKGEMHMTASPVGRDQPFPCFLKSNWGERVVVKIVQPHQAGGPA